MNGPNRKLLVIAGAAVAVLVAIGVAVALSGGDDGEETSTEDAGVVFAPVTIEGGALAPFEDAEGDPAVGTAAPALRGLDLAESPITVEGGEPTLLVFLAHWCPHCQAELPLLVDLAEDGAFDGIRTVAVLTGTNPSAPNFPPAAWLEREGWTGEVLVDDERFSTATAYGLTSYPYLVALDAEGNVAARAAGELPAEDVRAMVAAAS